MRLVLTTLLVLASGSAFGSSITTLSGVAAQAPSIAMAPCIDCPPLAPRTETSTYQVPTLPAGTQKTEIRDVAGEKKLVRTESWLGGSPVVYVSKLNDWDMDWAPEQIASPADNVDFAATTGALTHAGMAPGPAVSSSDLAVNSFELRLQPVQ
jgi:hypothetical protein